VEDIVAYIAKDSQKYAIKMSERIFHAVERLELFPESGWVIPEFGIDRYREIVVSQYRILYRFDGTDVFITAVVHGARDLKKFMRRPE
jgi:toxin ParE1/3/4